MNKFIFLLSVTLLLVACGEKASTESSEDIQQKHLQLLTTYMTGSYNSAKQAAVDTNYFDISLEMSRIWEEHDAGIWLYVEQAVTTAKDKPYRQRVYQLQTLDDSTFSSTVYSLPGAARFIGAYTDSVGMGNLTPDSLTLLTGCDLRLQFDGKIFKGKTGDSSCLNNWGEAAYATSKVSVSENQLESWDQGWNKEGEQVWGAENGPYIFDKIK